MFSSIAMSGFRIRKYFGHMGMVEALLVEAESTLKINVSTFSLSFCTFFLFPAAVLFYMYIEKFTSEGN